MYHDLVSYSHLGKISAGIQANCGQGQHCGDAESYAIAGGFPVDPERHPGEDDYENARNVDLNEEVPGVSLEVEGHL